METENFEDLLKRKLQEREISPSAKSWEKLSANLDATQEKKKPFVLWMGIAASIIGGILILSLVFNNTTPSDSPEIVDTPKEEIKLQENPIEIAEEIFNKTQVEEEQVAASEIEKETITPTPKASVNLIKERKPKNREAVAALEHNSLQKESVIISSTMSTNDKILDIKLNVALASVLTQTKNEETITDAEINKLLVEAASKISRERYKNDFAEGKVDPQDLLQAVEMDMENSFREKVFGILKDGYFKARTAVANRNY